MKLIVNPKTDKQMKEVKAFLEHHSIDYIKVEEETSVYQTKKTEKSLLKKERIKSKLVDEINEAVNELKLIRLGKKKARNAEDFLNEL